ncbi:MAG TPA: hypothetical protein VLA50_09410 [Erythrobacter sp.]|nr:hypothetical protein [Erythrobacter sp.]
MAGCASAALALALTLAPERAAAQAINAGGNVTDGVAFIDNPAPGQTTVDVVTPTAVIDWTPAVDNMGNALIFLPAGNTVRFQSGQLQNFAVLNRILPSANNNIAVINGNVISRIVNPASGLQTPGGTVAFYSPTGLLIGSTAMFDVGSLLLTTLDTSPASFANFFNGGNLSLQAAAGSTARIQIAPGAQISALAENSFFAVVAADIEMLGTARINGSHAYVAGEFVNIQLSNGLFNITVPIGTAASGEVVTLNGNVGGPSSMGAGDNHILYAVARAQQDPISMLFSGNLGFDPAQSAGIVNGEIILAANYDVFGRNVDTGSISQGIDAVFRDQFSTSDVRADITLLDVTAGSSVLAIGTGQTIAGGNSFVDGNLLLVGRDVAAIDAIGDETFEVTGDVLIDARDYGVVSSSLQTLDEINAVGTTARILAQDGGIVRIGGNALVTADAFAGADDLNAVAGSAQGGMADITASGGSILIDGLTSVRASGFGTNLDFIRTGAVARGGSARVTIANNGSASFGQDLAIIATGIGANGDQFGPSTVSDAFGGTALLALTGAGTVSVGGTATLDASANAGSANAASGGAQADAGEASVSINGAGTITISGDLNLTATAFGGDNAGGKGGTALGGAARAVTQNAGQLIVEGDFSANGDARGGDGLSGGDGFGGIAGANAITGAIDLMGNASADASGSGGNGGVGASIAFGGDGGIGRGGNAFFQANGTANVAARLTITGDATVLANGTGGEGGASDGQAIAAGNGGDGFGGDFTVPNQADTAFTSGAFLLAGGDYGTISVGGDAVVAAQGSGGRGGAAFGQLQPGRGGNGFGGLAQAGLALLGGPGTVGGGSATFNSLMIDAIGFGGGGGLGGNGDMEIGAGGDGTGGSAALTVAAGSVSTGEALLVAAGLGGMGGSGGLGTGGSAVVFGGNGGSLDALGLTLLASGSGGFANAGTGGNGLGGTAGVEGDGIAIVVDGGLLVDASGSGGASGDGAGGEGTGGEAYVGMLTATPGSITVTGHTQVFANGQGGDTQTAFAAGNGRGGLAYIQAQGGGTITLASAQAVAIGTGGQAAVHEGGDGFGGTAELRSLGTGSSLVIQRNVPNDFGNSPGNGAILSADGIGGNTNGGDGVGGAALGGTVGVLARGGGSIALPLTPNTDPASVGSNQIWARGFGGGSSVEGGAGGNASGGTAIIEVDGAGSSVIAGETFFTVFSQGGSSTVSTSNVTGGNAFGGRRIIRVLNGGEATLAVVGGASGARGGDASGTGNGGNATTGRNSVELVDGTLNIVGTLQIHDESAGGDGNRGGDVFTQGEGGALSFFASNSALTFAPDAQGQAGLSIGGTIRGGAGVIAGGNAQGVPASFTLINTDFSGGLLRIAPLTIGGSVTGAAGQGGNAIAGSLVVGITDSTLDLLGEVLISSDAEGGEGGLSTGSTGGDATSGPVTVTLTNSTANVLSGASGPGILHLSSQARSGFGNQAGDATSAAAVLNLAASSLVADQILVNSLAFANGNSIGQIGGIARSGAATISVAGASQIDAGQITIDATAQTGDGGMSFGGTASLLVESGSTATIDATQISVTADAFGGNFSTPADAAGRFVVNIGGGNVNADSLFASASGNRLDGAPAASELVASGGSLNIANDLFVQALDDINIRTGGGGIIGGPRAAATTTSVNIQSGGLITIDGDNNAAVGLGGNTIRLIARDIAINAGARIGADQINIISTDRDNTAVLGGTMQGSGFTLTNDEVGRISGRVLRFEFPGLRMPSDPNQPGLLVRDVTFTGSGSQGFDSVEIFVGSDLPDGIARFEGTLSYANAAANDLLRITARRLEVVTPGGIRMTGANGAPVGNLTLNADDIWAADAATITQLQANRSFVGRDALLAVAASGSDDPLGYIRAGGVTLNIGNSLLVRNTGTTSAQGGILIGGGTLSIASSGGGQSGGGPLLDVFAYGRRQTAPGTFVVGEAFFDEVNFNRVSPGSTAYLDAAAFNDCIINTGVCPEPPPPPEPEVEAPPEINNPTVFSDPIVVGEPRPSGEGDDDRFGIDFPEQPEAPLISEDPLLDDPVTSGGDATVYGAPPTPPAGGK